MSDDANRIRVGERITIYARGKNKTYVADFWLDNATAGSRSRRATRK